MDSPCSWCVKTSEQIDSIEYKLELLTEENKALKERISQYEQPIESFMDDLMKDTMENLDKLTKKQAI